MKRRLVVALSEEIARARQNGQTAVDPDCTLPKSNDGEVVRNGRPPDWAACCARNGTGAAIKRGELKRILTAWSSSRPTSWRWFGAAGISTRVNRFIQYLKIAVFTEAAVA